jgi:hypothetical protein
MRNRFTKLKTFVGDAGFQNLNPWVVQRRNKPGEPIESITSGDENKLQRIASQQTDERLPQFFHIVLNSGYNDRDIEVGKSRFNGYRD